MQAAIASTAWCERHICVTLAHHRSKMFFPGLLLQGSDFLFFLSRQITNRFGLGSRYLHVHITRRTKNSVMLILLDSQKPNCVNSLLGEITVYMYNTMSPV